MLVCLYKKQRELLWIPKPKAARDASLSELIKLARLPDVQEGDKLKNVKARQGVVREDIMLPHDVKKKLLDASKLYAKMGEYESTKKGGASAGDGGASRKDLKALQKSLSSSANASRKFFTSAQESINTKVIGLKNLTVAQVMNPKNDLQIAKDYGAELDRYLADVRSAKTEEAKTAALNKAKASMSSDLTNRAKELKSKQFKLAELNRRLKLTIINKNRKKKEAILREINELLANIQKGL